MGNSKHSLYRLRIQCNTVTNDSQASTIEQEVDQAIVIDSGEELTFADILRNLFGVFAFLSVSLVAVMILVWIIVGPTIDWRDPVTLRLSQDTFYEIENGTVGEAFTGSHHDLVPGDYLDLGTVSFSNHTTRSSTSCYYDSDGNNDCWTTYWDVFMLDIGGMNFSVEGDSGFKHTCFNAFCSVTATVEGDAWRLDMYGQRLTITVQEYEWVRWCRGKGVCE